MDGLLRRSGLGGLHYLSRVEIKNLRWRDVDLLGCALNIRRSKTAGGHRTIPLNRDSMAALMQLLERARALVSNEPEHYVFPACEPRLILFSLRSRSEVRGANSLLPLASVGSGSTTFGITRSRRCPREGRPTPP